MTDPEPWDQQPRESPKAWAAFVAYRNMDPSDRSTAAVAQQLGKSKGLIDRWSSMWSWVQRAAAFDKTVADAWQTELLAKQGDAVTAIVESAMLLRTKAHDYFLKLSDDDMRKIKPDIVIRMFLASSRMLSDAYAAASKPRPDDSESDLLAILAEIRAIVHPGDE